MNPLPGLISLPGPFEILRVLEHVSLQPHDFVLKDVAAEDFLATRAAADPRFVDPGSHNLIMSFHSFVVRTPAGNLLIDTCVGNNKQRPSLEDWHLRKDDTYLHNLAAAGLAPEDIDFVCCTHLHADHIGWNTKLVDGRWVPTFPKAKYLMAAEELDFWQTYHAQEPDNLYRNGWRDSVLPVLESDQCQTVTSDHEPVEGVRFAPAPGHTPGNIVIHAEHGTDRAVFSGDVIHHAAQIERPDWMSNFCWVPEQARDTRQAFLQSIADSGTVLLPAHFAGPTAVCVESAGEAFRYVDP